MVDQIHFVNVEYLNCVGSMTTNDARCTCEIKSRIAMPNAALNRKKTFLTSRLHFNFKEEISEMLHLKHSGKGWRSFGPTV